MCAASACTTSASGLAQSTCALGRRSGARLSHSCASVVNDNVRAKVVTKGSCTYETPEPTQTPSGRPNRRQIGAEFPYRFLPFFQRERCQIGPSRGTKKLKLRKTLHLADTIGDGKRSQENPPPGTTACKVLILNTITTCLLGLTVILPFA